ncbi:unnamed protein product [Owenia fusiformis]|uniref:Uncharacterized protein n=1 Tax=Owenia fusiformis TaxID=6347 RepID=A0A8S4Q0J1_OWEFU|nr:unnamed protein product [Owenia fusiformis]
MVHKSNLSQNTVERLTDDKPAQEKSIFITQTMKTEMGLCIFFTMVAFVTFTDCRPYRSYPVFKRPLRQIDWERSTVLDEAENEKRSYSPYVDTFDFKQPYQQSERDRSTALNELVNQLVMAMKQKRGNDCVTCAGWQCSILCGR